MPDPKKLEAWGRIYSEQRTSGQPGWAGADSYKLKQSRIEEALSQHGIHAPGTFLELGCGAGNIALWMASKGFYAYGIDIAPEAIEWAMKEAGESDANADFCLGDLSNMSMFGSDHFDVVFDGDCLHMIVDKTRPRCLVEVLRVLKPRGLFIAGGNVRDESINEKVEHGGGKGYFDPRSKCLFVDGERRYILLSEEELCSELRSVGFSIVKVNHHPKRGKQPFIKESIAVHATKV